MRLADIATLFDYSAWATDRILDQAAKLTPEQFTQPPRAGTRSVRATLAHALDTEITWRERLETGDDGGIELEEGDVPTVGALRRRWDEERAARRAYLASLDEGDLDHPAHPERPGLPRWHILVHLVNHGTQHRSEVAERLTDHGHSPGDLDFVTYLRARP